MALNGCLRCARYSVFGLNFIVWVSGMVLLVTAIYLRMDPQTNHVMNAAYAEDIRLFHFMCYALIGSGATVTFVGFLGCCSAFQESRCMLAVFFAVLFALLSAEILIGVWSFLHVDKIKVSVNTTMADYVQNIYGKHPLTDEPIDYVQHMLGCCGGTGPSDWSASQWSNRTSVTSNHQVRYFVVPSSCCVNRTVTATVPPPPANLLVAPLCLTKHKIVIDKGCGDVLRDWLNNQLFVVAICALVLLGIQSCSLCLSLVLCCGLRQQSAGGYKT